MTSESGSREVGVISAGMFHLQTFGGCIVTHDGAPLDALSGQRKVLALMAVLAASGEYGISRDVLLSYLWPESSEPRARSSLNQLIHAVRQQLRTPDLLIGSTVLRLNPERITSDTSQFRDAMKRGDHEAAVHLVGSAVADRGRVLHAIAGPHVSAVTLNRDRQPRRAARVSCRRRSNRQEHRQKRGGCRPPHARCPARRAPQRRRPITARTPPIPSSRTAQTDASAMLTPVEANGS